MSIADLPIFQALKTKMSWHQSRQGVLAANIANADTPEYRSQDLKQVDFRAHLKSGSSSIATAATSSKHLRVNIDGGQGGEAFKKVDTRSFEVTPDGNSVVLEEQMMKVTQNQMDFQAAATLYSRGLGLIRTAISRGGS